MFQLEKECFEFFPLHRALSLQSRHEAHDDQIEVLSKQVSWLVTKMREQVWPYTRTFRRTCSCWQKHISHCKWIRTRMHTVNVTSEHTHIQTYAYYLSVYRYIYLLWMMFYRCFIHTIFEYKRLLYASILP